VRLLAEMDELAGGEKLGPPWVERRKIDLPDGSTEIVELSGAAIGGAYVRSDRGPAEVEPKEAPCIGGDRRRERRASLGILRPGAGFELAKPRPEPLEKKRRAEPRGIEPFAAIANLVRRPGKAEGGDETEVYPPLTRDRLRSCR